MRVRARFGPSVTMSGAILRSATALARSSPRAAEASQWAVVVRLGAWPRRRLTSFHALSSAPAAALRNACQIRSARTGFEGCRSSRLCGCAPLRSSSSSRALGGQATVQLVRSLYLPSVVGQARFGMLTAARLRSALRRDPPSAPDQLNGGVDAVYSIVVLCSRASSMLGARRPRHSSAPVAFATDDGRSVVTALR